jgi:formylglycine-generating enzyme required for sulfatase activity
VVLLAGTVRAQQPADRWTEIDGCNCRSRRISIFSKLLKRPAAAPAEPEVFVAAFGKHPAWDDHLDDLGLETPRLVSFKSVLYSEGIAANIDSGAWEKLDPAQRVETWGHDLLWWMGNDVTVGRLWASADGKGRTKYPMVVLVQCRGVSSGWAIDTALGAVARAQQTLQQATTRPQVIGELDRLRDSLREQARANPGAIERDPRQFALLAQALHAEPEEAEAVGDASFGRAIYAIEREAAAAGVLAQDAGKSGPPGGGAASKCASLRLPVPVSWSGSATDVQTQGRSLRAWLDTLLSRIDPGVPMLLVKPQGRAWVDAMVGEPGPAQVFALRAGEAIMPKVSRVPYTLDSSWMQNLRREVESAHNAAPAPVTGSRRSLLGSIAGHTPAGRLRSLAMILAAGSALAIAPRAVQSAVPGEGAPSRDGQPHEPSRVNGRARYNQLLEELLESVTKPDVTDEQARAAVQSFIDQAQALPGGIAFLREADQTIAALRAILQPDDAPSPAPSNPPAGGAPHAEASRLGPGSLPGAFAVTLPDNRLRFTLPGRTPGSEIVLDFFKVRVLNPTAGKPGEGPSSTPPLQTFYLCTTEVSARTFSDAVSTLGSWERLAQVMPPFRAADDERLGPRVWQWTFGRRPGSTQVGVTGLAPAGQWLVRSEGAAGADVYPPGLDPGQPTLDLPMQHVPPDAAMYVADLLGCRLPTSAEWKAAAGAQEARLERATLNLRDQTWARQQKHTEARLVQGRRAFAADSGGFVPSTAPALSGPKSAAVVDEDDHVLWFSPIALGGGGSKAPFKHLVGNVAEWVWDGPWPTPGQPRGSDPGEFQRALDAHPEQIGVIGGSALSRPDLDVHQRQPVLLAEAREGYADVGFRLAFSVGGDSDLTVAQRAAGILTPLPRLRNEP